MTGQKKYVGLDIQSTIDRVRILFLFVYFFGQGVFCLFVLN